MNRILPTLLALLLLAACRSATPPPLAPASPSATRAAAPTATAAPTAAPFPVSEYDARAGTVQLESTTLGVPKTFYVYTPPGYDEEPERRFPVLYLFRGHEREWLNATEDGSRRGKGNVLDVYEALLAEGKVGPMILVFPGISSEDNSVPGMLVNFRAAEQVATKPGVGTGRFEDFFIQEVIPYVDANFRTVADRSGRGVDGFSLGGFMATKIVAQHPELFRTAGAFDGTFFYTTDDCDLDVERDQLFGLPLFAPAFSSPPDAVFGAENNGATLVCALPPETVQSILWLIQYGPEAAEPNDANFYRGEHFVEQLTKQGATNGIEPILPGGHRWATADEHMRQTLPFHWQALSEALLQPAGQ